jgi:pSer/pThr/pTyr-binding forkhead associated (FHA) protein
MSAAPVLTKPTQIVIKLENGPQQGQVFQPQKSPIFIGREVDNDITFAHDSKMSRRHVELSFEAGKWIIRNLSSKNILQVNGREVAEQEILGPTSVKVGESEFMITAPDIPSGLEVAKSTLEEVNFGATRIITTGNKAMPPSKRPPGVPPSNLRRPSMAPRSSIPGNKSDNTKLILIGVVIIVGLVFILGKKGPSKGMRQGIVATQDNAIMDLQKSQEMMKTIEMKHEQEGKTGLQFQLAQEQYLKGFRDYRQGQYSLAMTAFSAALGLYPTHDLAKKYYYLSKRKFDEKVQVYMIQGKRYYGKNNYRLCRSSYESVMVMIKNESDPIYKEARQFRNECALKMEGKF